MIGCFQAVDVCKAAGPILMPYRASSGALKTMVIKSKHLSGVGGLVDKQFAGAAAVGNPHAGLGCARKIKIFTTETKRGFSL